MLLRHKPIRTLTLMDNIVLTRDTIKRLAKDVREITKNPLITHGVHYVHDNDNILKGHALIIGPVGTPYENGCYIFDLLFPASYPQEPPKVVYYTNDGVTRFNPNLYRSGKVCLSMLNTWRGDQWTSCNTISSILLTLCTIFNDNPLLNEPGKKLGDPEIIPYNKIITYKNIQVAIGDMVEKENIKIQFPELHEIIKKHFISNYNKIVSQIENNIKDDGKVLSVPFFNMTTTLSYKLLAIRLEKKFTQLTKNNK